MIESTMRKIITASAGTGKTYRLSLEFFHLLLKYRHQQISFNEILVITFTRKATSEIRSAIFKHLEAILAHNEKGLELTENLQQLFGLTIGKTELEYLKIIYEQMLINKHKLQISTIDSFVNTIFKGVIAPYIGIRDFQIDTEINNRYLPDLYNHIFLDRQDTRTFFKVFETAGKKTIEQYDRLILSIIDNRWLLELIKEKRVPRQADVTEEGKRALALFRKESQQIIALLREHLQNSGNSDLSSDKCFMSLYRKIINKTAALDFLNDLEHLIDDEKFLKTNWKEISKEFRFWQIKYFKDDQIKEKLEQLRISAQQAFCEYIFFSYLLPEEEEILTLANHILTVYDKLKMRDKILTYSDIAYYTFKYLYDPALSLIDADYGSVSNRFYEYLSNRTRFILIDEFQDTGIVQHKLLFPIISEIISGVGSKEYGGVIIVGDEKQSIYGWRDGERELLLNMPFILQTRDSSSLNKTYRSSQFITGFINQIFKGISEEIDNHKLNWRYEDIDSHSTSQEGYIGIDFLNISKTLVREEDEPEDQYQIFVDNCLKPLLEEKKINPADSVILARDNNHLREIARALEDNGIDYFLESSFSFLQHQTIKPIIYLLKYLANRDVLQLFNFLRSDFALLSTADLKKVALIYKEARLKGIDFIKLCREQIGDHLIINKTISIIDSYRQIDPIGIISRIIKEFNVTGLYPEEHNIKNLHLFLESVSQFFYQNKLDYPKNVSGLLQYLADNEKNEEFQQANIDQIDSLQLMTVHKAKGLEFDNVFFYYHIGNKGGNTAGNLQYLYRFNDNFTELEDYILSYNYSPLLKNMNHPLQSKQDEKELLEELNNIYVALTRAKRNISLFLCYECNKGLIVASEQGRAAQDSDKIEIKKLSLKTIIDFLNSNQQTIITAEEIMNKIIHKEIGILSTYHSEETFSSFKMDDLSDLINLERDTILSLPEKREDEFLNFKTAYLENKKSLIGDLVHYYLSFVRYAEPQELEYARRRTITLYGNLILGEKIDDLITKIETFIDNNQHLFSRSWTKIFTEKTIFDERNREYRIDRILVDDVQKLILLIDYKTGSIKDREQLDKYQKIITGLPFVMESKYIIETSYIDVKI